MTEQELYRETWAEIDLKAIEHNIKQVKQTLPDHCDMMAVVKANAYGHGAIEVAKTALHSGATFLAVALLEEALTLRESGIEAPILVLGRVSPEQALVAAEKNITLMFFQKEWIEEVNRLPLKNDLHLHLKLDTGFGRLGIREEHELKQIINYLQEHQHHHIKLTGVYTHFATADEADTAYFKQQLATFEQLLDIFMERWDEPVSVHIGNSAASLRFPNLMRDYIRLGVSMYGLYPSEATQKETTVELKQAFSLHSRLTHVKKLQPGEGVGYGITYKTKGEEWIGTFPIGYADGWRRSLQGASVLVNGKRCPIVGRVCMDQTMVLLDQYYPIGTKVTLIGRQGDEMITMDEVAEYIQTINYEVPCMITSRVPRIYVNGSE